MINTAFAPDVSPNHLSPLDGRGPFARFDEAALRGPTASLRSGQLVGYTGWARGHFPERLRARDGKFYAEASAADGRATSGCHDPLPWLAACCERVGARDSGLGTREEIPPQFRTTHSLQPPASSLGGALCSAVHAVLRTHMPVRPGALDFAHHNPTPGWVFRADRGAVGHFAHIENALYLYLWTGDLQARELWYAWLSQMRVAGRQFTACDRETHTHFVRCHLAAVHANDATYDAEATRLARLLISKPAAEHKELLYHPLWPYYAWQRLGKEAEPWIVAAADWLGPTSGNSDLVVAAIAYWITGKREYLTRKFSSLIGWVDGYFRDPAGGALDWIGQCTGRTGDNYAPNGWPIFKRACLDAGLTDADVPRFVADNSYPLAGKLAIITGADISRGMVRYLSYQGDTNGGRLRALDAADKRLAELIFEGPWGSNRAAAPFDFASLQPPASSLALPVTRIQALAYQQLLGPLTDDPTEAVQIEPGKPYELGRARGVLEFQSATAEVTLECLAEHVTFYNEQGQPALGLFAGYHGAASAASLQRSSPSPQPPAPSLYLDARGPQYLRWRFTCTAGGRWKALRE